MDILKNISHTDDGIEGYVLFELFDHYIEFLANDISDIEYVNKYVSFLNSIPNHVIDDLANASIR